MSELDDIRTRDRLLGVIMRRIAREYVRHAEALREIEQHAERITLEQYAATNRKTLDEVRRELIDEAQRDGVRHSDYALEHRLRNLAVEIEATAVEEYGMEPWTALEGTDDPAGMADESTEDAEIIAAVLDLHAGDDEAGS